MGLRVVGPPDEAVGAEVVVHLLEESRRAIRRPRLRRLEHVRRDLEVQRRETRQRGERRVGRIGRASGEVREPAVVEHHGDVREPHQHVTEPGKLRREQRGDDAEAELLRDLPERVADRAVEPLRRGRTDPEQPHAGAPGHLGELAQRRRWVGVHGIDDDDADHPAGGTGDRVEDVGVVGAVRAVRLHEHGAVDTAPGGGVEVLLDAHRMLTEPLRSDPGRAQRVARRIGRDHVHVRVDEHGSAPERALAHLVAHRDHGRVGERCAAASSRRRRRGCGRR